MRSAKPARPSVVLGSVWQYHLAGMGLTKVTTRLTSLVNPKKSFESLFLVDTGATDSMAPSDELQKLGVREEGKIEYPCHAEPNLAHQR